MSNTKQPPKNSKQKQQSSKQNANTKKEIPKAKFPRKFPFWARLKIDKRRTTLVIDEDDVFDKQKKELVDGYVHREATHTKKQGEYEEISPNPDKYDSRPMYLKRPKKLPKNLFEPHNKKLSMPKNLEQRYENNNHKFKKKQ